jgi:hypothetical protein
LLQKIINLEPFINIRLHIMNNELEGNVTFTSKEELHQDEVGQNMD